MKCPLSGIWRAFALASLLLATACASLPDAPNSGVLFEGEAVSFDDVHGTVSAAKSAAIIASLEVDSGASRMIHQHLAVEQAINPHSPLVLGNALLLLEDGPATYRAILAALAEAKDHINLETFIFADDAIGNQFAEVLLAKQAAGVQVNLIYDSVGCLDTPLAFFARLEAGGVRVLEFNPVNPLAGDGDEWLLNNRDHRKLLVVDGRVAFLGGVNISETYASSPFVHARKKDGAVSLGWRDTHLQVSGPVVAKFQALFLDTWARQNGPPLPPRDYFPPLNPEGKEIVRAMGSTSAAPHSVIYLTLLSAIASAQRHINISNAYFVPDPQLLAHLTDAAHRGVTVTLLLPSRTDSWATFHAGRSHYSDLLKAGVNIYERQDAVMHSKTATIDGLWSTIGSTNLDWRSFLHNDELNAILVGPNFARQMDAMFARDLRHSKVIEYRRWRHRPLLSRIKEWIAVRGEYWL